MRILEIWYMTLIIILQFRKMCVFSSGPRGCAFGFGRLEELSRHVSLVTIWRQCAVWPSSSPVRDAACCWILQKWLIPAAVPGHWQLKFRSTHSSVPHLSSIIFIIGSLALLRAANKSIRPKCPASVTAFESTLIFSNLWLLSIWVKDVICACHFKSVLTNGKLRDHLKTLLPNF